MAKFVWRHLWWAPVQSSTHVSIMSLESSARTMRLRMRLEWSAISAESRCRTLCSSSAVDKSVSSWEDSLGKSQKEFWNDKQFFFSIRPSPGLLPVSGPLERYMTPTLDMALLSSSRAGADLGWTSDVESDVSPGWEEEDLPLIACTVNINPPHSFRAKC